MATAEAQRAYRERVRAGEVRRELPAEVMPWTDEVRGEVESAWQVAFRKAMTGWLLGQASKNTRRAYAQAWRSWSTWCTEHSIDVTDPGPGAGGAYAASLRADGKAEGTVRLRCVAVRAALEMLTYEGLRSGPDPFARVKLPASHAPSATVGLTTEQVVRLVEHAKTMRGRYEAAVRLCAMVGLRAVEAGQVCEGTLAVDQGGGVVSTIVRKGGTRAVVPIPDAILAAAARDRWPHLVGKADDRSADAVSNMVAHVWRKAGLPGVARSHALRHWHATVALTELGIPLHLVQDSLGHRSPVTTQGYNDARNRVRDHSAHAVAGLLP